MPLARPARRSLRLETLEDRQVLSGMVSAVVQDGNLTITGNAAPNEIAIYAGDNPGEILIAGATTTGDASGNTVVNGSHAPVLLTGVTGNIAVNLAGGDDRVVVTNVNLAGNQRHAGVNLRRREHPRRAACYGSRRR